MSVPECSTVGRRFRMMHACRHEQHEAVERSRGFFVSMVCAMLGGAFSLHECSQRRPRDQHDHSRGQFDLYRVTFA